MQKLIVWLFVLAALPAGAQKELICGNGKIDTAKDAAAMRYLRSGMLQNTVPNYLVRVFFHICRNSDGTNAAMTLAQMATEFATLQAQYAPDNICFLNCGYNYIDNTTINTSFNADDDPDGNALKPYLVSGCINAYYLTKIKGNNTACNPPCGYGGIALGGIPGLFFLVASGNIGKGSTIAHECGHNLGLLHTFETAYGYEKIDGSNGSSSADKVADTKADPFAYNGQDCYSASNCVYTGSCTDPDGATNFKPPYSNLMSYWWSCGTYTQSATSGQFTRANSFLNTDSDLQTAESPGNVTLTAVIATGGYYMNSALSTLTFTGANYLGGSVHSKVGAANVTVLPGYVASAGNGGMIEIVTRPCN